MTIRDTIEGALLGRRLVTGEVITGLRSIGRAPDGDSQFDWMSVDTDEGPRMVWLSAELMVPQEPTP